MTSCGRIFWHYFATCWRVNGRSRLRCASPRKQLPLQPRTSADQFDCQKAYLAGLALPVALYEGDGADGGEWPKRYLRARETPQITCYVMFARARAECVEYNSTYSLKMMMRQMLCCTFILKIHYQHSDHHLELLDPCKWDRQVVPKRRYETAILRCVEFQKSVHLIYTVAKLKWGTIIIRLPLIRWYGVK
jgi:hypothetical protein